MRDDAQPLRVVYDNTHRRAAVREIGDSELRRKLSALKWLLAAVLLGAALIDVVLIIMFC